MKMYLRRATAKDFDRINDLFREMLRAVYKTEEVKGHQTGDLDYYFSDGEDWICVAEIDGVIEGFLSIEVHREEEYYLYYDDLSVSKNFRKLGIGTALMTRAEDYCKSIGFSLIALHVEENNESARRLYEKSGFVIKEKQGTRLLMIKQLDKSVSEGGLHDNGYT